MLGVCRRAPAWPFPSDCHSRGAPRHDLFRPSLTSVSAAAEGRRLHAEVTRLPLRRTRPPSSAVGLGGHPASSRRCQIRHLRVLAARPPLASRRLPHTPANLRHVRPNSFHRARPPPYTASSPSLLLPLKTSLLQYGIQGSRRNIQAWLAGNRDGARLGPVFVLAVATPSSRQPPTTLPKKPGHPSPLHPLPLPLPPP